MYFHFPYYWSMLKRIWAKKDWKNRNKMLFRLVFIVPLIHVFHSIFFFLDKIIFIGLWSTKIEKPIFVVGHARSGTTLIHRLLVADQDRFNYFLYWEMFFPSLLQKKIIRGLGVIDHSFLSGYFLKKLQAWDDKTFGPVRHIHNMSLWMPEEDDFVMQSSFFAGYWQLQAPMMDQNDVFYLDKKPEKMRRKIMNHYKECIRRQLYLNGGNKIHLSKNPVFSGRVESIIEAFPDARIIVNIRNPLECVPSNLKLMKRNYRGAGWEPDEYANSLQILEDMSYDCFHIPKQALLNNPHVPAVIVDYRELITDPKKVVEDIYHTFDLEMTKDHATHLEERSKKARKHNTKHSYSADEFGMDTDKMRSSLSEFYQQYHWDNNGLDSNIAAPDSPAPVN